MQTASLGSQNSLCGGGRYDGLVKEIGGPDTPAVGVAMGIERALMVLDEIGAAPEISDTVLLPQSPPQRQTTLRRGLAYAVCLTERRSEFALIVKRLRDSGMSVDADLDGRSAKSQFRQADKSGAALAIVIGDEELDANKLTLKDLSSGNEIKSSLEESADTLRKLL